MFVKHNNSFLKQSHYQFNKHFVLSFIQSAFTFPQLFLFLPILSFSVCPNPGPDKLHMPRLVDVFSIAFNLLMPSLFIFFSPCILLVNETYLFVL